MAEITGKQVGEQAVALGLVTEVKIKEVWKQVDERNATIEDFSRAALEIGALTAYQIKMLRSGERKALTYGDYKVLAPAGEGILSTVVQAHPQDSRQIWALKILRSEFSKKRDWVDQFIADGELGMTLQHPNIAPVHEVYSKRKVHFWRLDFFGKPKLDLYSENCPPLYALKAMASVARALCYAFEKDNAHGNIKKSNILINSDGVVQLADFCVTNEEYPRASKAQTPTTVDYHCLEQLTDVEPGDIRSDIYFCGCLLYEMLTGKAPLPELQLDDIEINPSRYLDVVPINKLASQLPKEVATIVDQAMQLDIDKRYQAPIEFLDALKNAIKSLSVDQTKTPEQPKSDSGPKRTFLVVDNDPSTQAALRKHLKSLGHRVVICAEPDTAILSLVRKPDLADCIVFVSSKLGLLALKAFNDTERLDRIKDCRVILLLDKRHNDWYSEAKVSELRIAIKGPLKARDLNNKLEKLFQVSAETD